MSDLLSGNLLEPLTFSEGEIWQFIQRHSCGLCPCDGWLVAVPAGYKKYYAWCPEHGNIIASSVITKHTQAEVAESRYIGRRELRQPSGKSPEEIIKELGF